MRPCAVLLCALALAGCGHDPPPSSPDAGTPLTCPASDKPLGSSALTSNVVHQPSPVQVGQSVEFDVPAGTVSITIVEQAVSAPDSITLKTGSGQFAINNTAVPLLVKDPSGAKVFDDNQDLPADLSTLPVFFASESPATGTLTIPNTTAGLRLLGGGGLAAGTWSFVVSDFAYECTSPAASPLPAGASCDGGTDQSLYDVTVITKAAVSGAIPASGKLDLAVYFATTVTGTAGGAPLDAAKASAGQDPDLNRMEATLGRIFGQAGIQIGTVTYTLLPADVLAKYATGVDIDQTGACAPLAQLLKLADAGNTLNIFFVSALRASDVSGGQVVVGVDGTIPGPSSIGGTVASGAAVATLDLRAGSGTAACAVDGVNLGCGADTTAYIIAHEAGHFLGLYHTTEAGGTLFDPLDDTLTCVCSVCAATTAGKAACSRTAFPHQMTVAECSLGPNACGGGTNLMFWSLGSGSQGVLSDQQKSVMRANPLVQIVP